MTTRTDVHQTDTACVRLGDLIALPLTYEAGGELLDARGKNLDEGKSEREIDDVGAAVVRALNAHDAMLAALRALRLECLADPLNPCWAGRPDDKPGLHWGSEHGQPIPACSSCVARAAIALGEGRP